MRAAALWSGVLGALVLAPAVRAQPAVPYTYENRAVTQADAVVRSGASDSYYATGKLTRGEVVQVVTNKKDVPPGWLAIKPPRGSFSWVNAQLVKYETGQTTGIVLGTDTAVLAGSALDNQPPHVRAAVLDRGAMVVILGQPLLTSDGSRWLPIEPHPTEVRYLPAAAVAPSLAGAEAVASRGLPVGGAAPLGFAAEAKTAPALMAAAPGAQTVARPASYAPATSMYGPTPAATSSYGAPPAAPALPAAEQWAGPGWLRKADFVFENKPVYRLETTDRVICYVVAQPGFSLDSYLGTYLKRPVYLYGAIGYRGEMARAPILAARAGQAAQ